MNDGAMPATAAAEAKPAAETAELLVLLGEIWNRVVVQVNKLLDAHSKFPFVTFKENLNPTLAEVLQGFEYVDFALSKLLETKQLEYEETRIAINSKQCILKMKELGVACDNHRNEDFERVMGDLRKQAV